VTLDCGRRVAFRAGRRLELSPKELAVLECLLSSQDRVLSAERSGPGTSTPTRSRRPSRRRSVGCAPSSATRRSSTPYARAATGSEPTDAATRIPNQPAPPEAARATGTARAAVLGRVRRSGGDPLPRLQRPVRDGPMFFGHSPMAFHPGPAAAAAARRSAAGPQFTPWPFLLALAAIAVAVLAAWWLASVRRQRFP
jgi:hypothetical protein